jgi:hypothetical protein
LSEEANPNHGPLRVIVRGGLHDQSEVWSELEGLVFLPFVHQPVTVPDNSGKAMAALTTFAANSRHRIHDFVIPRL